MATMTKKQILKHLGGSAETVDQDLQVFSEAAKVLSSDHPRLIDEHQLQWIGVYQGKIAATAQTLASLKQQLNNIGVPAKHTIVRFIDKDETTLIL
ncbi:MAG: hypothetical protein QGF53_10665 [Alphaproteobacteria bacterium]|jgi:transposase|nr:hypothetical protein [Alphaproteobacteria bacterium]